MKIRFYLAMAAAALVMTNCSQDEELAQVQQGSNGFTATIEESSRSAVTDEGVFSWTVGDKFSVWNGTTFDVYANSETNVGYFEPSGTVGTPTGYAIYPSGSHAVSGNTVTVNLPATYPHGSTNAAMLAAIETGSANLAFKHLGGLMRFNIENVPANATSFVFTATNDILTGDYVVNSEGEIKKDGENTVNNNNSVTITFDAFTAAQDMTFYVPLPVGTYGDYKVEIKGESISLSHESTKVTNTIGRRTLLLMPTFTVDGTELKKGAGSTIAVTAVEANVSGNQSLTINAAGADATATLVLNYTPQEGNATLNLSDGSDATTPQTSAATVKVVPTTTTPVEALNINTPTLTVELGAGEYGTVEALTATQTLKIGANVTIGTLVLNGGNLEVDETATIGEVVVKNEAGLKSAIAVGGTVKLDADIALTSCLSISKDVTLNLNGNDITATNTAIYVTAGTLTVEGEGSVSAANGTAQCAVWAAGGEVVINGGTFSVGVDETGATNSCIYSTGAQIIIEGGSFSNAAGTYGGGGIFNVQNGTSGKITINAVDNITVGNGSVVYEAEDLTNGLIVDNLILTESALKSAIAAGGTVKLGADIALTSCLSISKDVTLNLNGNDITATNTAIYVTAGTLTVEGEGSVSAANGTAQCAVWAAGGEVVINGGTFSVGVDENGATNSCIYSTGAEITVNGGSFSNAAGTYGGGGVFNVQNGTSGKITITAVDNVTVGTGSVVYEAEDLTNGLIVDNRNN